MTVIIEQLNNAWVYFPVAVTAWVGCMLRVAQIHGQEKAKDGTGFTGGTLAALAILTAMLMLFWPVTVPLIFVVVLVLAMFQRVSRRSEESYRKRAAGAEALKKEALAKAEFFDAQADEEESEILAEGARNLARGFREQAESIVVPAVAPVKAAKR